MYIYAAHNKFSYTQGLNDTGIGVLSTEGYLQVSGGGGGTWNWADTLLDMMTDTDAFVAQSALSRG